MGCEEHSVWLLGTVDEGIVHWRNESRTETSSPAADERGGKKFERKKASCTQAPDEIRCNKICMVSYDKLDATTDERHEACE